MPWDFEDALLMLWIGPRASVESFGLGDGEILLMDRENGWI